MSPKRRKMILMHYHRLLLLAAVLVCLGCEEPQDGVFGVGAKGASFHGHCLREWARIPDGMMVFCSACDEASQIGRWREFRCPLHGCLSSHPPTLTKGNAAEKEKPDYVIPFSHWQEIGPISVSIVVLKRKD